MKTLHEILVGQTVQILGYDSGLQKTKPSLQQRLMEMGLTEGVELVVEHFAPFGGGMAVRCRGVLIALRTEDAQFIHVK